MNIQPFSVFYTGVVEDNNDPLKLGRVRARLIGLHTENKTDLPTTSLPWADPIFAGVGNVSEVSALAVPECGSWVVCAFHDVKFQRPFYIGTLPRIETVRPTFSEGFSDPNQIYPTTANLGRTSISKVATGETGVLANKPAKKTGSIVTEPESQYAPTYPKDKVIQTSSGHVIELDDTSGKERIQVMHKSGTFIEMHSDGKAVIHTKAGQYIISDSTINIYGTGNINIESAANVEIKCVQFTVNASGAVDINGSTIDLN